MKTTLSIKLLKTLQQGKNKLSLHALNCMKNFVISQRANDESFVNKNGISDIYYTVFGWMLAYVLGIEININKANIYLNSIDTDKLDLVHYAAYTRCCIIKLLIENKPINLLWHSINKTEIRTLDSFIQIPQNDIQAPYTQFIWLTLIEDTGNKIDLKSEMLHTLLKYRNTSGGYNNTINTKQATTNATAAALAVIGQLNGYKDNEDIRYLQSIQLPSGGFTASKVTYIPDILSTATALFTLKSYNLKPNYMTDEFIEVHWLDSGGFAATLMDNNSDVEYTFYGLLALGSSLS